MQLSDEDLVQRTLAGDRAAFGQLVRKYQNVMYAMACSKLLNAQDAEDVVQPYIPPRSAVLLHPTEHQELDGNG